MKNNGNFKRIMAFFLLLSFSIFGELKLEVSKNKVYKSESTELRIVFENIQRKEVEVMGIENFNIISSGQSSETKVINGKGTNRFIISLVLNPKTQGKFNLIARSKDKTLESNLVEIEVTNTRPNNNNELFSTSREVDKREYYFGEKILLTEKLISKKSIQGLNYLEPTKKIEGFSIVDLNQGKFRTENTSINGESVLIVETFRGILEPLSSGEKEISQSILRVSYEGEETNSFFYRDTKEEYLAFNPIKLKINPLPVLKRPNDFGGIVGRVEGKVEVVNKEANVGDGITVNVKLSSYGNLDKLESIYKTNKDYRVFESLKSKKEDVKNGKYYVEKEFEVVFIPQKSNLNKLPDLNIPYFDTEKKEYNRLIIKGEEVKITGNLNTNLNPLSYSSNDEIESILIDTIEKKDYSNINYYLIILVIIETLIILILIFYIFKDKILIGNKSINSKKIIDIIKKEQDPKIIFDWISLYAYEKHIDLRKNTIDSYVKNNKIPKELGNLLLKLEKLAYKKEIVKENLKGELINNIRKW